ncbi:group II truncated hemoglobin [Yersinia ruckeri]|uniref:group II truncated hemoglobin n=1 Tax=Yersinia ruckeri TaxID=29486 RepID=UPI0022386C9A|nr:group II truncated hemoglobin [Yersinia ruckeri]MCW6625025.1 group II truncated hemoglobin [Yersinia ruckeri]
MSEQTPTLFEWMGGREVLLKLMTVFYAKIEKDELLAPMFAHMHADHPEHVAIWLEEVLGGEANYTAHRGGFKGMVAKHRGRAIQPEQRKRWVDLMMECADEVNLPADPEFRSAFAGYIEFGSRRAQANSQPKAERSKRETVKLWGWGEAPPGTP